MKRIAALATVCLVLFAATAAALAQPLADRVPADSFFYVGWRGSATPDNGYAGSHLQAMLAESKFSAAFDQLLPQLFEKFNASDQDQKQTREMLALCGELLRYPGTIFVEPTNDPKSPVRTAILIQAGPNAEDLKKRITEWRKEVEAPDDEFKLIASGDVLAMCLSYGNSEPALDPSKWKATSLAGSATFASAIKQVDADCYFALYIDVDNTLKFVDQMMVNERAAEDSRGIWSRVRESSGLNGVHRLLFTGKFEGKDWASAVFVNAPAPRRGLITLLDTKPLGATDLKAIPRSAVAAHITRFDFADLVKQSRGVVVAADKDAAVWFDRGLGAGQMVIGRNIVTDILEPLGDTWVTYADASLGGLTPQDVVMINVLDNPQKALQSANALSAAITNVMNSPALRRQMGGAGMSFGQQRVGDLNVTTMQAPAYSLAWTVGNGRLAVGGNPEAIAKAIHAAVPANGFDQNEKFAALSKQLAHGAPITAFSFADLPATAAIMYSAYEKAQAALRTTLANEDLQLPDNLLPPLATVLAHVAPSAEVGWSDDRGLHARSISPFPMSDLFSDSPSGVAAQAAAIGGSMAILIPSLNRARETANRVKCASNERQIAQAILLYSNDHKGGYPPDLGTLILNEDISPDAFVCPDDKTRLPKDFADMAPQQKADWINQNTSYVYIGQAKNNNTARADEPIFYEKESDHGEGMNITFGDGHVEFQLMPQAKRLIEQQRK